MKTVSTVLIALSLSLAACDRAPADAGKMTTATTQMAPSSETHPPSSMGSSGSMAEPSHTDMAMAATPHMAGAGTMAPTMAAPVPNGAMGSMAGGAHMAGTGAMGPAMANPGAPVGMMGSTSKRTKKPSAAMSGHMAAGAMTPEH